MADDDNMANNGNDARTLYQDAATAQLSERVTNMGRRINDVEVEMRAGFSQLGNSLNAATNETRSSIASLSTSMAERSRPQWQALSVMLAVLVVLGGLVYWPIREATGDLKTSIISLSQDTSRSLEAIVAKMVTREELDWRSSRGAEDRARTEAAIAGLRTSSVDRDEWLQQIHGRDQEIVELSRRIDELRQNVGNQYTTRDLLLELQQEIKDLRERTAEMRRSRMSSLP